MAGGRPSLYTKQLGELICAEIATGRTLKSICSDAQMPSERSVHGWLTHSDKKEFLQSYREARRISYDVLAESLLDTARGDGTVYDSAEVNHAKLIIWTTQWYLGKMASRKYGDKLGEDDAPVTGLDLTKLTDTELDAYVALLNKMKDDQ